MRKNKNKTPKLGPKYMRHQTKVSRYTGQVFIWGIRQGKIKQATQLSAAEHNHHHPGQPAWVLCQ